MRYIPCSFKQSVYIFALEPRVENTQLEFLLVISKNVLTKSLLFKDNSKKHFFRKSIFRKTRTIMKSSMNLHEAYFCCYWNLLLYNFFDTVFSERYFSVVFRLRAIKITNYVLKDNSLNSTVRWFHGCRVYDNWTAFIWVQVSFCIHHTSYSM